MAVDTRQAFALFLDNRVRQQVRILILREAVTVLAEAGTTPFHGSRVLWANRVIHDSKTEGLKAWILIVANAPALPDAANITDTQITGQLVPLINALAGASAPVPDLV